MVGTCEECVFLSLTVVLILSQSTLIIFLSFFRSFNVRKAATSDLQGVKMLVETLSLNEGIWNDSKIFTEARRDPVSICC